MLRLIYKLTLTACFVLCFSVAEVSHLIAQDYGEPLGSRGYLSQSQVSQGQVSQGRSLSDRAYPLAGTSKVTSRLSGGESSNHAARIEQNEAGINEAGINEAGINEAGINGAGINEVGIVEQLMNRPSRAGAARIGDSMRLADQSGAERYPEVLPRHRTTLDSNGAVVRSVAYESYGESPSNWQSGMASASLSSDEPSAFNGRSDSFIERERGGQPAERESARDTITRIAINLGFVLALTFGILLVVRRVQKNKAVQPVRSTREVQALNVRQVLPLSNGASLHVVEGVENRILVAIDAGGIKSVNVLAYAFEQALEKPESTATRRPLPPVEPIVHDESTAEIDEKLIRMLLTQSKKAA